MKPSTRIAYFLLISCLALEIIKEINQSAWATDSPPSQLSQTENNKGIKVSLFGQPCLLQGPFPASTLKAIHEISPEQMAPMTSYGDSDSLALLKKSLSKLTSAAKTPPAFDRYRDRLSKRMEAQLAFIQAIHPAQKNPKTSTIINAIKTHLSERNFKNFETTAKKLETKRPHGKTQTEEFTLFLDQLGEAYNEALEPNPEEDFHIAAQKLKVKYNCSFDEAGEDHHESTH